MIHHFTTRRRHGDARAPGALARFLKAQKWPTAVATAEQVHGDKLAYVGALRQTRKFRGVDGLLTDQPLQPLAIFTADCVPLFLTDRRHRVVGLLHAGWRGTRARILRKAARLVHRRWGISARQLQVWAGPAIGQCCFEVQWDVARYFPFSRKRMKGRLARRSSPSRDSAMASEGGWTLDLAKELRGQARRLGIRFLHTPGASCTMHDKRFYSYRRDRTDKRLVSVIMKTGRPNKSNGIPQ